MQARKNYGYLKKIRNKGMRLFFNFYSTPHRIGQEYLKTLKTYKEMIGYSRLENVYRVK